MPNPIRTALIDDHPLFREGVRLTLGRVEDFEVVAEGANADDAIHIARTAAPDIILMDVRMPGSGIAAAAALAETDPEIKVVLLTASESESDVTAAMAAGVRGYVLKGVGGLELAEILRAVHAGQFYVAPALAAVMLRRIKQPESESATLDVSENLTAREDQILNLVAQGLTNKEIARKLDISEKTVKHYMTLIMQKMHVRNRVEAVLQRQRR